MTIAERVYTFLLVLRQEKGIKSLNIVLEGTLSAPKRVQKRRGLVGWLFGKKEDSLQEEFYNPYEAVELEIRDLATLPYSFAALLHEVQRQHPLFGECHSARFTVCPPKKKQRTAEWNTLWVYTERLGVDGDKPEGLVHFKNLLHTNERLKIFLSIPVAYEKEFFTLEKRTR